MLTFGERLLNAPVLSLQTGAELAQTEAAVIDPHNLTIIAYYISGEKLDFSPALLMTNDIREVADIGLIVNSSDDFISPTDVVTLKSIVDLNFNPTGLKVVDTEGRKLGKVLQYSIETRTFTIQQLHVAPPLLKTLSQGDFLVHRNQITAVTDKAITVRAPTVKAQQKPAAPTRASFSNPFRQQQPETEHQEQ